MQAFFVLVGDHGVNAVPEPCPRPGCCRTAAAGVSEQLRVQDPAIDIDSPSHRDTAAGPFVGMKGPSDTTSQWDVTDEVVRNTHVAHALLHDPLQGVVVPCGKIGCVGRGVCLCSECASAWSRVLLLHEYPRVTGRAVVESRPMQ